MLNTGEDRQDFWTEITTLGKIREAGDSPDRGSQTSGSEKN